MKIENRSCLAALCALLVVVAFISCSSRDHPSDVDAAEQRIASEHGSALTTLADGPTSLRVAYIASRQADGLADPRFRVVVDSLGLRTERNGGFDARFDRTGVELRTVVGVAGRLETGAIGCQGREVAGPGTSPVLDSAQLNRVSRGMGAGASEWYVNGPLGIEHGYVVELAGCDRVASVEIATPGFLPATVGADVRLTSRDTGVSLRYAALSAYDRDGRALPASFDVDESHIVISVDVSAARGPITIDPLIYFEEQRVGPSRDGEGDTTTSDFFGTSVALSGDTAIVGAPSDDIGDNVWQGAVYIFVRSGGTWIKQAKLTASDGRRDDAFGLGVDLSGDTALVGAPFANTGPTLEQGAAYVFVRNGTTWNQQAKLTASGRTGVQTFGQSVALSGDTALVGAIGANQSQGSAHVFVRSGAVWSEQAMLTANDGAGGDEFGMTVALSGDTALVGAWLDDIGANQDQGSAYVFVRSGITWSQQAKLTASDGAAEDIFGSVALSGDTALVGANLADIGGDEDQGAAYVFVRSGTTWNQQAKLTRGAGGDSFGGYVALAGDVALVGAPFADVDNEDAGAAYTFVRNGTVWSQQSRLRAGDGLAGDAFGFDVALSGSLTAVGAPQRDGPGAMSEGAVYFGLLADMGPCVGMATDTPCRASSGPCDIEETCDGVNAGCPVNQFVPAGTPCGPIELVVGASDAVCDHPDTCDRFGTCEPNYEPPTTICRAAAGPCDVAETCDGVGTCAADSFAEAGTVCYPAGEPQSQGVCTGTSSTCAEAEAGGCCGAGAGRASLWLGLVVLGSLIRRRVPRFPAPTRRASPSTGARARGPRSSA